MTATRIVRPVALERAFAAAEGRMTVMSRFYVTGRDGRPLFPEKRWPGNDGHVPQLRESPEIRKRQGMIAAS